MKIFLSIVPFCMLALFLVGCSDKDGKVSPAAKAKSAFAVDDLPATSVVIRVNGHDITKADYTRWYRLRDRIFRAQEKIPPKLRNEKTTIFARNNRMRVPYDLVRHELIRQESDRKGIRPTDAVIRNHEKKFMANINRAKEPFSAVDSIFGQSDAAALREMVRLDACEDLCVRAAATNDLDKVTDAEIDAQIAENKKWNERADETNKVQRARALRAKRDILNGGLSGNVFANATNSFRKVFARVTNKVADREKNEGGGWQVLDITEALEEEGEEFMMWLARAKPGDVSDPLVMDDETALAIVGLVATWADEDSEPGEPPIMQYELVRCVFDVYEKVDVTQDRAELAKGMLELRRTKALQDLLGRLLDAAKIEFPRGKGIFRPRAKKKKPKAPAKGKAAQKKAASAKPEGGAKKTL